MLIPVHLGSQCEHPDHRKNRKIWPEEDESAVRIEQTEQLLVNCQGAQAEIDRYRARTRQASTASTFSPDRAAASETPDALVPDPAAEAKHSSPTPPIASPTGARRSDRSTPLSPRKCSQAHSPPVDLLESSPISSPVLPSFPSTDRPATTTATAAASVYSSPLTRTSDISSGANLPVSPCSLNPPHTPIPVFAYDTSLSPKIVTPVKDPAAMLSSHSQSYDTIPLSGGPSDATRFGGETLEGNDSLGIQNGGGAEGMPCPMEILGSSWAAVDHPDLGMNGELDCQNQMSKPATKVTAVTAVEARQGLDPLAGNVSEEDMDLDDYLEFSSTSPIEANGPAHGDSPQGISHRAEHRDRLAVDGPAAHHSDGDEPGGLEAGTGEQPEEELGGGVQSPRPRSYPAPGEPEREEHQDALGTSVSREPTTSELDNELLDELLEDVEMEEASRACRGEATEKMDDDKETEQPSQVEDMAGRAWAKIDDENQPSGSGDICGPRRCDFQAQEDFSLSGDSDGIMFNAAPLQAAIPFTPSPSIRSDDSPRPPDFQKTSRRRNRQNSLKIHPSGHQMKTRGQYKAAVDRAVLSALKKSVLRERSAAASERAWRTDEVRRREEAELRVSDLECEKEGWGRERAMLIGEIKRLRGWELSEPTEGDEHHDGPGDGDGATQGEVGIGLKRARTRKYTVGEVPSFKPFMPDGTTGTRTEGVLSKSRTEQQ